MNSKRTAGRQRTGPQIHSSQNALTVFGLIGQDRDRTWGNMGLLRQALQTLHMGFLLHPLLLMANKFIVHLLYIYIYIGFYLCFSTPAAVTSSFCISGINKKTYLILYYLDK